MFTTTKRASRKRPARLVVSSVAWLALGAGVLTVGSGAAAAYVDCGVGNGVTSVSPRTCQPATVRHPTVSGDASALVDRGRPGPQR